LNSIKFTLEWPPIEVTSSWQSFIRGNFQSLWEWMGLLCLLMSLFMRME